MKRILANLLAEMLYRCLQKQKPFTSKDADLSTAIIGYQHPEWIPEWIRR